MQQIVEYLSSRRIAIGLGALHAWEPVCITKSSYPENECGEDSSTSERLFRDLCNFQAELIFRTELKPGEVTATVDAPRREWCDDGMCLRCSGDLPIHPIQFDFARVESNVVPDAGEATVVSDAGEQTVVLDTGQAPRSPQEDDINALAEGDTECIHSPAAPADYACSEGNPDPHIRVVDSSVHGPLVAGNALDEMYGLTEELLLATTYRIHRMREIRCLGIEEHFSRKLHALAVRHMQERSEMYGDYRASERMRRTLINERASFTAEISGSLKFRAQLSERRLMVIEESSSEAHRRALGASREAYSMTSEVIISTLLRDRKNNRVNLQSEMRYSGYFRILRTRAAMILLRGTRRMGYARVQSVIAIQACIRGHLARRKFSTAFGGTPHELLITRVAGEARFREWLVCYQQQVQSEIDAILEDLNEVDVNEFLSIEDEENTSMGDLLLTLPVRYEEYPYRQTNTQAHCSIGYVSEVAAKSFIHENRGASRGHSPRISEGLATDVEGIPERWIHNRGANGQNRRRRLFANAHGWK